MTVAEPEAPPAKRTVSSAWSSSATSTGTASAAAAPGGRGPWPSPPRQVRDGRRVAKSALTSVTGTPATYEARSSQWTPRSKSAKEGPLLPGVKCQTYLSGSKTSCER